MKSFIDFVADASKDEGLLKGFMDTVAEADAGALAKWFSSQGYSVSGDICSDIIDKKDRVVELGDAAVRGPY